MIRQPICVLLAHVDHGKTSILDRIRGSSVAAKEAGGITQSITAHSVDINKIKDKCGELLDQLKLNLTIPGILFIDSPGHEAFTTLRKRGGNISDIAILVVDVNEGAKPQTLEVIEILKNSKTPFIIAANKIDKIHGWIPNAGKNILQSITEQRDDVQRFLDTKLYELVGKLSEYGLNAERFDRVENYTKQIAIVPISAKTGDGFSAMLMVLAGLAQRYLEESLKMNVEGQGKATILEVSEEKGIGKTLDCVVYDGSIKVNDKIIIGSVDGPIESKIKSLFQIDKNKLKSVESVHASAAVKICGNNLDKVAAGMPLSVANQDSEKIKEEVKEEVDEVFLETDNEGIVVKADTLGSLEALHVLLSREDIPVKRVGVGDISKKDISEALSEEDVLNKIIVGFNVKANEKHDSVKIINHKVIYKIVDDVKEYIVNKKKELEGDELKNLPKPFKIKFLKDHIFRQSGPAVVGVEVLDGTLKANSPIMKDGKRIGEVKSIQYNKESVNTAEKGKDVAVSLPGVTVGRQIKEEDIIYSDIDEDDFKKIKSLKKYLNESETEVMREIAEIKRRNNPVWGI